ncbi:MAG: cell division protein FtsL [Nitrospirota bacterium]
MGKRVGIVLLLLFFVLFCVWQHISMIKLGYEIEGLQIKKRKINNRYKELLIKVEELKSLERIERIAISKLKMKRPEIGQVIVIKKDVYPLLKDKEKDDRLILVKRLIY